MSLIRLGAELRMHPELADAALRRQLALFLFQDLGLWGGSDEYYRPENSSLVHVLRDGRGLPISLSCI
ncbi:MAG: hypothetical protein CSA62_12760 [Planctomycetota bacterium]|nr:MAG: hypothetical protein CSA62_12760 [Planctomycetota bacterium]